MSRQGDVVHAGERVIGPERLGVKHVETGMADMAALDRCDQGGLVRQGAARGVDQDRARLEPRDPPGIEEAARLLVERKMERDHVGGRKQRVEVDERNAGVGARAAVQATTFMPMPWAMRATSRP